MNKRELFRILSLTDGEEVTALCRQVAGQYEVEVLRKPETNLVMLKVRENARNSLFYAGEALACECMVRIGEAKGFAACLGDDLDKVYAMAVIDAVLNGALPACGQIYTALADWGERIDEAQGAEAGLTMSTKVNFSVMEE